MMRGGGAGMCGSTCALLVSHASSYHGVHTVTVGGLAKRVASVGQQFYSFPGLQVYDSDPLYYEWYASSAPPAHTRTRAVRPRICLTVLLVVGT